MALPPEAHRYACGEGMGFVGRLWWGAVFVGCGIACERGCGSGVGFVGMVGCSWEPPMHTLLSQSVSATALQQPRAHASCHHEEVASVGKDKILVDSFFGSGARTGLLNGTWRSGVFAYSGTVNMN